jgi:actin related protein 2/3 complex subunit 1A/1B
VTCGQDRNAYVFHLEKTVWTPTLVILRLDRAATCVKWSPKEDKFAVGTGSKAISVCYFDTENSWWVSKHIRGEKSGISSTIKCLTWHPNNIILAAGGTDCAVHVYSTFVKGIDNRKDVANGTPFGSKLPWATLLATFPTNAWIHDVAFSPSGFQLAWVTHDSFVYFLDCATENHRVQTVRTSGLPFQTVIWAGENTFIAAGHDANPSYFQGGAMNYTFRGYINKSAKQAGGQNQSAAKLWQQRSGMGTTNATELENTLPTAHQNAITQVRVVSPTSFSSVGNDGQLAIWTYSKVSVTVQ